MGDEADGVPGIQHLAPGFGRKTAVKLLNKHGSLENLLKTAAIRTVGKEYAQEVLVKHADYLRKNYEVLSLRRYEFTDILNAQNFHLLISISY
jgi:5'-3' exonuclease